MIGTLYRARPVTIEAMSVLPHTADAVAAWVEESLGDKPTIGLSGLMIWGTFARPHLVAPWSTFLVRTGDKQFRSVNPVEFHSMYEPVVTV